MPVHDWTRVPQGIFHHVHGSFIIEIKRLLNRCLPDDYYALLEQDDPVTPKDRGLATALPTVRPKVERDGSTSPRRRNRVVVRHVSGDRVVSMVEIVSPGNKGSRAAVQAFVRKAGDLLSQQINLMVLDLHAPGPRDPFGIHAAIWEEFDGAEPTAGPPKPFVLASYESAVTVRAYLDYAAVGEELGDMPLFLDDPLLVNVPLESADDAAFREVPARWRTVLEAS